MFSARPYDVPRLFRKVSNPREISGKNLTYLRYRRRGNGKKTLSRIQSLWVHLTLKKKVKKRVILFTALFAMAGIKNLRKYSVRHNEKVTFRKQPDFENRTLRRYRFTGIFGDN